MTISNFDKSLLIEQIRYIETEHALNCDHEDELSDPASHHDFHQRLWQRAECVIRQHDLSTALAHAARISRYIKIFTLILVALLGAMGTGYAITDTNTINIYWLLLVLLGFNFISMLLWLIGISLNVEGLTSGIIARISGWLPGVFENRINHSKPAPARIITLADRAWLKCIFSGTLGKWQLSRMTHQLWLVYLLAGLLSLVMLLMVRQYDFIWGTTLLSDSAFIQITDALSRPLDFIGFSTPTAEQVQQSRLGADQLLTAEHRASWAQFLLGSLLLFGITPRALLLVWSTLMSIKARRLFTLDLYLPYYMNLRQRLMPLASHGLIVDADTSPPTQTEITQQPPLPHALPDNTKWVAVELSDEFSWPIAAIQAQHDLGQVIDRESLAATLQQLQTGGYPVVAAAVAAARLPDRGIQRTITNLMADCKQRWLVLLQLPGEAEVSSRRLASWYQLAQACDIPPDQVISMSVV